MRWYLVALAITTIGCSESGRPCGGKFLILWPNANGDYAPTVVATPTLQDAKVLSGPAARVYYEASIDETGFRGKPAEPHLSNSGDVCVPTDAGSSAAVSAYAQFERLRAFDQKLGVAEQVSWPRNVGVEMKMTGSFRDTHNNAHYVGDRDITTLVPTTWPTVPAAMNVGIVAHEHFHAHFQSQVMNQLRRPRAINPGEVLDASLGTMDQGFNLIRQINETVVRGWNEGLADLYAAIYTGDPRFLRATFQKPEDIMARALDAGFYYLGKDEKLAARAGDMRFTARRAQAGEVLTGYAYQQGTALARVLYRITRLQTKVSPTEALTRLMKGLDQLPRRLAINMDATELDFADIVPAVLDGLDLENDTCAHLRELMRTNPRAYGRIASCLYAR